MVATLQGECVEESIAGRLKCHWEEHLEWAAAVVVEKQIPLDLRPKELADGNWIADWRESVLRLVLRA
jgi:hypothetical protein